MWRPRKQRPRTALATLIVALCACTNSLAVDDGGAPADATVSAKTRHANLLQSMAELKTQLRDPATDADSLRAPLQELRDSLNAWCRTLTVEEKVPSATPINSQAGEKAPGQKVTLPDSGVSSDEEAARERERRRQATLDTYRPGPPLPGPSRGPVGDCQQALFKLSVAESQLSRPTPDRDEALAELEALGEIVRGLAP